MPAAYRAIDAASVIQRRADVQFVRLDDELLAIDADAGFCYSLNRTGGTLWHLLEHPVTLARLCETMARDHDVDDTTCRDDVIALLGELEDSGLVRIDAAGTA